VSEALFSTYRPLEVPLEAWPVTSERFVGEPPTMTGRVMWRSADGRAASGVWTCTPGVIRGEFLTDEVSVLLAGRMTITADGRTVEARAGDVITMRKGLEVEWVIHEQVTKAWNVSSADPLPF
jgi:uncharacterized cupin superfamily protein